MNGFGYLITAVPCLEHWCVVVLKYELARDLTYDSEQQLKASHSNRFHRPWLPDWRISNRCSANYDTPSVTITDWLNVVLVRGRRCAPTSLLFVARFLQRMRTIRNFDFFRCINVNSYLSLNQMTIISFSNCFELAWRFASLSSLAYASLKTLQAKNLVKKWSVWQQIVLLVVLDDDFVNGHIGLTLYRMVMPIGIPFLKEKNNN